MPCPTSNFSFTFLDANSARRHFCSRLIDPHSETLYRPVMQNPPIGTQHAHARIRFENDEISTKNRRNLSNFIYFPESFEISEFQIWSYALAANVAQSNDFSRFLRLWIKMVSFKFLEVPPSPPPPPPHPPQRKNRATFVKFPCLYLPRWPGRR